MVFEGTQTIFVILKWIGILMAVICFGMAIYANGGPAYASASRGSAAGWVIAGASGVSLWIVAVIGEMLGYIADRARRMVELLEQINTRTGAKK